MRRRNPGQEGTALLVVLVTTLLAAMLFTAGLRTAWLNELVTGNEVDYQRAFDNAEALLRDAEFDIQGIHPDGSPCREGNCRQRRGDAAASSVPALPRADASEFGGIRALLGARRPSCMEGICVPEGVAEEFWRAPAGELDRMKAVAAHYGQFSGAPSVEADNPLLASRGWYWIEILPFDVDAPVPAGAQGVRPDADNPYVFRITAVSEGRKPATRAVLQTLVVLKKVAP